MIALEVIGFVVGLLSALCSCLLAGMFWQLRTNLVKLSESLVLKVEEFDTVTKKASLANTSLGDKVVDMAKKQALLEEKVNILLQGQRR